MYDTGELAIDSSPSVVSKADMLSREVSYMKNKGQTGSIYSITVEQALEQIRSGSVSRDAIDQIRNQDIPEDVRKERKNNLPAFIFSGLFSYRNKSSCTKYQHQSVLDFDDVSEEKLPDLKAELKACPYIFAFWISPGGMGVKAIVPFRYQTSLENMASDQIADEHKIAYGQFKEYLEGEYPLCVLDITGSDLPRLCYDSYDPDIVIKEQVFEFPVFPVDASDLKRKKTSSTFSGEIIPEEQLMHIQRKANPGYRRTMKSIIKYLEKRELSITDSYRTWYLVGQAIANSFSYSIGRTYYLRLCKLDQKNGKYNEQESLAKLAQCYSQSEESKRDDQVTVRTIMRLANDQGWKGESTGKKSREERLILSMPDEVISF